jgi:hypothetical protein
MGDGNNWLDGRLNVLLVECSNDLIVGLLDFDWRDGWMYILYLLDTYLEVRFGWFLYGRDRMVHRLVV